MAKDREDREAAAAALLIREGIPEPEARRLAASAGYATVRRIIANADALAARGMLRSRRSYIALGVRDGYALFQGAERDAARALNQKAAGNVSPEILERMQERRIVGAQGLLSAGVVMVHEVADLDGRALCGLIASRLEGGAGRAGSWPSTTDAPGDFAVNGRSGT